MLNDRFPMWRPAVGSAIVGLLLVACSDASSPSSPTAMIPDGPVPGLNVNSEKGFIGGWFDGTEVSLRYTKPYFCESPPASSAPSGCVVGAEPEVTPRAGPIPLIWAVVPAGFTPDLETLHCLAGIPCLNHPTTLDLSRIGGPASAPGAPHSHIITSARAGWHNTVNVRVTDPDLWDQIVAARSLDKVRELQADPANMGRISQDTPTNIYFFFSVHSE